MFPKTMKFVASIRQREVHFCNGCLISQEFVLTSGQCIHRIFEFGELEFSNITVMLYDQFFNVDHVVTHKLYHHRCRKQSIGYDIGLILVGLVILVLV